VRIVVDLAESPADVELAEPDVFDAFAVVVTGGSDPAHLDAALRENGVGRVVGDDVHVRVDAVRELAGDVAAPQWEQGFAKMLEFARTKGWIHPDEEGEGEAIQAHVEWGEARGNR
jgi:hypothetical protein